jgi:hypothetical protein
MPLPAIPRRGLWENYSTLRPGNQVRSPDGKRLPLSKHHKLAAAFVRLNRPPFRQNSFAPGRRMRYNIEEEKTEKYLFSVVPDPKTRKRGVFDASSVRFVL